MNKTFRLILFILIAIFSFSVGVCASEQLAVGDIVAVDSDDLLDIELFYADDEKSYCINLSVDYNKEEISAFCKAFNALPIYGENDMPENYILEITLFYDITSYSTTIYNSEEKGLVIPDSSEMYYIRIDDFMNILEELGLEWEENNAGGGPVVSHQKGDIDKNGSIDVNDAVLLLQHSLFPDTYHVGWNKAAVDFNRDEVVDMKDAILLLQHSVFPELYPLN